MVHAFKPVDPEKRLRDLRKDFKDIQSGKLEPDVDRVQFLAEFARRAHEERQLNMVMHAAQLCLDEDPDAPAALVGVYLDREDGENVETRLRTATELVDLARWIARDDLRERAMEIARKEAPAWAGETEGAEQRHRFVTLRNLFGEQFADEIRDQVAGA